MTFSKIKKKNFILIEVLIAIAILSLCLMPFLPQQSLKLQRQKQQMAYCLFADHFETKVCSLRERAFVEKEAWIEKCQKNAQIDSWDEKIFFDDVKLAASVKGRVKLKSLYDSKKEGKKIYRLQIQASYSLKGSSKKLPFVFYISIEE